MPTIKMRVTAGVFIGVAGIAAYVSQTDASFSAALLRGWKQLVHRTPSVSANDVVLRIVFDRQDHALSCEAASLKMVLASKEIVVTEADIMTEVGYDDTGRSIRGGALVWGDPDRAFVGALDGRMPTTGYGVHWSPIARAANRWRTAEVLEQMSAATIASHIRQGNPVIVWGFVGPGTPYSWTTPGGKQVRTVLHEHVYVVHGYRGSSGAPEGFYITDPIYGLSYVSTDELLQNMAPFAMSGVVVY